MWHRECGMFKQFLEKTRDELFTSFTAPCYRRSCIPRTLDFTSQCSNSLRTKHKTFISHYDEPRPVWDFKIGFRHYVLFMLCHDLCTLTITKVKLYFPTWWVRRYFHSAASSLSRRSKGLHYRQLWPQRSGGWGGHRPGVTHIINGQGSPVSRVKARHGWPGQYTLVIRL